MIMVAEIGGILYTDDPFNAEEIAIARNPGASVIRTQLCLPD